MSLYKYPYENFAKYPILCYLNCDEARFDGNSELVAELVTANGFKAAYAIKDGAEGPRGWKVAASFYFLYFFERKCFSRSRLVYAGFDTC